MKFLRWLFKPVLNGFDVFYWVMCFFLWTNNYHVTAFITWVVLTLFSSFIQVSVAKKR